MGFEVRINDDPVYKTDEPAENVTSISVLTPQGTAAVVGSPPDNSWVNIVIATRDPEMSDYLDIVEAREIRERVERREQNSPANREREGRSVEDLEAETSATPSPASPTPDLTDQEKEVRESGGAGTPQPETMEPGAGVTTMEQVQTEPSQTERMPTLTSTSEENFNIES